MGAAVLFKTIDIPIHLFGPFFCQGNDFRPLAHHLHLFRAGLDAGGLLPFFQPVMAPVTLVHHPVAGKGGQNIQIQPHPGLTLGNVPGADRLAFGPAQADPRINAGQPVCFLFGRAPGTQFDAGRIFAVHAPPGNGQGDLPAFLDPGGILDIQPVVGGQPVGDICFVRPVLHRNPGRNHLREGFFRLREFTGIGFFAGIDTFFATDTPADIDQRGQGLCFITGLCKGRPGSGNGRTGRTGRKNR